MYVKQVLNNNMILAKDENHHEKIIMAKGIGFQSKKHTEVDISKFNDKKEYVCDNQEYAMIREMCDRIPEKIINISIRMLEKEAKSKMLECKVSITEMLLLSDHIFTAIQRIKTKNIFLRNVLLEEIKTFYYDEFEISLMAKEFASREYDVILNDDEIGFIAIHLINMTSNNIQNTLKTIKIVDEIVDIVSTNMGIVKNKNSFEFKRFLGHLKYFATRLVTGEKTEAVHDDTLLNHIKICYTESFNCVQVLNEYVQKQYNYNMSNDDIIYLTLHLENLRKIK